MSWELLVAVGGVTLALVMGLLYARAAVGASKAEQYLLIAELKDTALKATRDVVAEKEEYIRELERSVLGGLPASQLVDRLNRLFQANRNRAARRLPPAKP